MQSGYLHNPITNPIDFRIDINNPYIVQQYSATKFDQVGDPNLRLKNLALIGNRTLHRQG